MTPTEILKLYTAVPFRPFSLHLADRRVLHVASRDFFAMRPGGRLLFLDLDDGGYECIDLMLVVSVRVDGRRQKG